MKATLTKEQLQEIVEKGLDDIYGETFDVSDIELVVNSPRGEARYVTATMELTPKAPRQAVDLSSVRG